MGELNRYSLSPTGGEGWGEGAITAHCFRHPHPASAYASATLSRDAGEGLVQ